jgi:hypothetical protein
MASRAARSKPSRELADLKAQLDDLARDVLSGELETGRAAVVNQVLNTRLRAIEQERKMRETVDLEERLAELEEAAAQRMGGAGAGGAGAGRGFSWGA